MSNVFSGLGFSGFTEDRKPIYDVVKNFDFFKIELGTSTKSIIDNWNVGTIYWLRECVYDRIPRSYGTFSVFICSSIWHGYYPGYYLCFLSLAIFTEAGRRGRKYIRPLFQKASMQIPYDILTALISMMVMNYCAIPFTQLEVRLTFYIWSKMLFVAHIGSFLVYIVAPMLATQSSSSSSSSSHKASHTINNNNNNNNNNNKSGDGNISSIQNCTQNTVTTEDNDNKIN